MTTPDSPRLSAAELTTKVVEALQAKWEEWHAALPEEAIGWPVAAVYVRESHINSMVGDSPVVQLSATLEMLRTERINVPWEMVVFEQVSGTELSLRPGLQDLIERAKAGEFAIIAAYLSHRLFRNSEEAAAVKRQLRMRGVRLMWVGKPTMDERDPSSWAMEKNLEIADEWHSRNTGWLVGRALEYKTLAGEPIGTLPEVWCVTEWAPGARSGRRGRPLKWVLAQPLAGIVKEGAERYIAGASFGDLAEWALTTELKGLTPAGKVMAWPWWLHTLQNPKLAGYHRPSKYMGFKPGKISPRRVRPRHDRDNLVRCLLPPIITLEQHRAIIALGKRRNQAAKRRRRYRDEVISGIARDARCGHRVAIVRHVKDGDYYLRCQAQVLERGHSSSFRGKDAADALEALIGRIRFDDERLLSAVEAGLSERTPDPTPIARVQRNAEVTKLRAALASLDGAGFADLRSEIAERIEALELAATVMAMPAEVAVFRAAVSDLKRWPEIWARASAVEKNELLRAAGVEIEIEPLPIVLGPKPPPRPYSRLLTVRASVPEFALALAIATGQQAGFHSSASAGMGNAARYDSSRSARHVAPVVALATRHADLLALVRPALRAA